MDGIHKLINILKPLINRGVTQIGDLIDLAQFFEHLRADCRGKNFASASLEFVHNLIHHILEGEETGGTFFKGFGDAASELAPIERLMFSVAFDHAQI